MASLAESPQIQACTCRNAPSAQAILGILAGYGNARLKRCSSDTLKQESLLRSRVGLQQDERTPKQMRPKGSFLTCKL